MAGSAPDSLSAELFPGCVRRQVNLIAHVTAEQFPAVLDVTKPRAPRGAVQGQIFVVAECAAVQPGDLVRRATHPLVACS